MRDGELALIAAPPGPLCDGLEIFLLMVPRIEVVRCAQDASSVLKAITESPPAVVLLDTNIRGRETSAIVRQIKTRWPQIPCLVLANTSQEEQDARNAGADLALMKGFSATKLFEIVENMVSG